MNDFAEGEFRNLESDTWKELVVVWSSLVHWLILVTSIGITDTGEVFVDEDFGSSFADGAFDKSLNYRNLSFGLKYNCFNKNLGKLNLIPRNHA